MNKAVIALKYEIPTGNFCSYTNRKAFEAAFCEHLDNYDMKCEVFNTSIDYSREHQEYEKCRECLKALRVSTYYKQGGS